MQGRALTATIAVILSLAPASGQDAGFAKPNPVIRQIVEGMPKGDKQEISVLTATFKPGDKTVFHTHRFPVTVYVLEGTFTLELDGRPPLVAKTGESIVEPPNVQMTGYNRSTSDFTKVVIFYVGDPGTPFLDLHH
jgi:quercetin dioxygenase-like cupin family protein